MNVAMDFIAAMPFDPYDFRSFPLNFVSAFPFPPPAHSPLPYFQPVLCVSSQGAPETLQPHHVVEAYLQNLQRSKNDALSFVLKEVKRENEDEEDHCFTASGVRNEWGEWSLSGIEEQLRELEDEFQVTASTMPDNGEVRESSFGNDNPPRPVEEKGLENEGVSMSESEGLHQRCRASQQSILDADAHQSEAQPELLECNSFVVETMNQIGADRDTKATVGVTSVDHKTSNLLERREDSFDRKLQGLISACPSRKSKSIHKKKGVTGRPTYWLRERKVISCRMRCTGCELGRAANPKSCMISLL